MVLMTIADTIQSVYNNTRRHPKNLEKSELGLAGGPRPNGYPLPQDIGAAYGTFRLLLKLITEEKITEPKAPTIAADISQAIQKLKNDLLENLERLVKPPQPRLSGKPNLHELWNAIKNTAMWMAEVAEQVVKTVFDFVRDVINTSGTAVADSIKYALYLLNKALFALYRSVRDILVLAADVVPFTQDLAVERGNLFNTRSLWCSPGDLGINSYPLEEFVIHVDGRLAMPQREFAHNPIASYPPYAPFIPPTTLGASVEQPPVDLTAPYRPASGTTFARPDAFIDGARGDDMFAQSGPQRPAHSTDPKAPNTFAADRRNFGGAMANCEWALLHWSDSSFVLPDYNLDSDRGYAWPCWDTEGQIASDAPPNQADPIYDRAVPDPLDPTDHRNPGVAHVNATMAN